MLRLWLKQSQDMGKEIDADYLGFFFAFKMEICPKVM